MQELGQFPLLASFVAGIATFVSPCILPLIPAFISYITGASVDQLKRPETGHAAVFLKTLFFVLGFSLVFVLLGASATWLGGLAGKYKDYVRWIGGILVILFGLHLTGVLRIRFLYHQARFNAARSPLGHIQPFLIGIAFAAGWTPCVGPILSSILILASAQQTIGSGILLLAVYSLGLGIPFLFTALFINLTLRFFQSIKNYYRYIEIASGLVLVLVGLLLVTDSFKMLTGYLLDLTGM